MIGADRFGPFLEFRDEGGCRHLIRLTSIQWMSDSDPCQDETLITAVGRTIQVHKPLDEVVRVIREALAAQQIPFARGSDDEFPSIKI